MTISRSRVTLLLLLLTVMLVAACGCAVGKPLALSDEIQLQRLREVRPQGLGYSVAVAPVLVQKTRTLELGKKWPLAVKPDYLQTIIAKGLISIPVFTDVRQTAYADPAAVREEGAQLLMTMTLSDLTASFGGTNGYFLPNMLIWGILSPVASAFVADEFFNVRGRINVKLLDTASGETVWSRSITLQERYDLNDWQRGPSIWDFFFIAPFYNTWTPSKVDGVVLPHVIRKIQVELAKGILTDLPPPKRSIAVILGLNSCGIEGAPELKYAEDDARDVAYLLEDSGFSEVILLTGDEVTREAIKESLDNIAARRDIEVENLVVYFAGQGTTKFNEQKSTCMQSLLAFGTAVEESELTLSQLSILLEPVSASNKTVVIDAGFTGEDGRSYPVEKIPAGTQRKYPEQLLKIADAAFFMSCKAGETSYEFDSLGHGVFTHFLLQRGLTGKADLNKDRVLTVQESLKSIAWQVTRHVHGKMQGHTQKPCVVNNDNAATRFIESK